MKLPNDEIVHYKSDDGVTCIVERTELVRCRDCKWLLGEICKRFNLQLDEIRCMEYAPGDNGYCSYGERKEQENE